jgi:hypothetical protein
MMGEDTGSTVSFAWTYRIFGAFSPDTQQLLLVIEAADEETAVLNVGLVAPYLGIVRASDLLVVELKEMPSGVPTFLDAFFSAGKISFTRESVCQTTGTLQ